MVIIRGDWAHLSRGKHCAKHISSGAWADRNDRGDLILDQPGRWMLHTSDGFARRATVYATVSEDLTSVMGLGSRFEVV